MCTGHAARVVGVVPVDERGVPSFFMAHNARETGNDAVHVRGREKIVCRKHD